MLHQTYPHVFILYVRGKKKILFCTFFPDNIWHNESGSSGSQHAVTSGPWGTGSVHSLKRGRPGNPTIVQGVGSTVRRESTPPLIPILEVSLFTSLQGKSFLLYSLATLEVHLFFITRRRWKYDAVSSIFYSDPRGRAVFFVKQGEYFLGTPNS